MLATFEGNFTQEPEETETQSINFLFPLSEANVSALNLAIFIFLER